MYFSMYLVAMEKKKIQIKGHSKYLFWPQQTFFACFLLVILPYSLLKLFIEVDEKFAIIDLNIGQEEAIG